MASYRTPRGLRFLVDRLTHHWLRSAMPVHHMTCLKGLRPGDTLIVWKLDRLGRSLRDLITMLDDLKQRRVKFRSLTEAIDPETPTRRAMWQMIGVLAELERSLITERTRAGMKAAQRRGVKFGRKPKLTHIQCTHAMQLIREGKSVPEVAALFSRIPYDALSATRFSGGLADL